MTNANKPISKFLAGPGAHPASSLRFRDLVSIPSHSNTNQISSESDFLHRTVSLSCPNMLPGDILEVRGLVVNNVIWRRTLSDWLIHDGLDVNWSAVTGVRASDSRVNFAVKDFLAHSALHADFVVLRAGGDAGVSSHREDLKSQGAPNLKQGRSPPETPATRRGLRRRRRHRARTRGRGGVPAASIAFSVSGGWRLRRPDPPGLRPLRKRRLSRHRRLRAIRRRRHQQQALLQLRHSIPKLSSPITWRRRAAARCWDGLPAGCIAFESSSAGQRGPESTPEGGPASLDCQESIYFQVSILSILHTSSILCLSVCA